MLSHSRPVSGMPAKKRVNEFLADLTELAVKHFPPLIDRTRIAEEDGYMIVTLKYGPAASELEMAASEGGIGFAFASVRWHLGGEAGLEVLFARAAGELLGILSGERILARIGEGGAGRGLLAARGGEAAAAELLRASAAEGERVILKSWNAAERPHPGGGG